MLAPLPCVFSRLKSIPRIRKKISNMRPAEKSSKMRALKAEFSPEPQGMDLMRRIWKLKRKGTTR